MKLKSIQFLRAMAALLVVYEHSMDIQMRYGQSWQEQLYFISNFGCIGVDLFFVISGFIIYYIANDLKGPSLGVEFFRKRFVRINPIYYVASFVSLGVYLTQLLYHNKPLVDVFERTVHSFVDTILIIPSFAESSAFAPLLPVGWTLGFEWIFYLFFFILIVLKVNNKLVTLTVSILLLVLIGVFIEINDFRLNFITNPILMEFVLGMVVGHIYVRRNSKSSWLAIISLLIGLGGYLLLIRFGYGDIWHYRETMNGDLSLHRFFLWGIPSSFIVLGCILFEKNNLLPQLWENKLFQGLGNASYSIYLIHFPILQLLTILYKEVGFFLHPDVAIVVQMLVGISIALCFYKFIEIPLLNYFNKKVRWNFNVTYKKSTVQV